MRKIVNGVLYDTDTAEKIYFDEINKRTLWRTSDGNFFTSYATGEIMPKKIDSVKAYLGEKDVDLYIKLFGNPQLVESELTIEESKQKKIYEMNQKQQEVIRNGVDVTLSSGKTERFSLKDQDQISIMGLCSLAQQGIDHIPWHESDNEEHCKYYSAEDINLIAKKAMEFIIFHVTWFRDLRIYILNLKTKEEINSVSYENEIPEEYKSDVLKDLIKTLNI